MRITLTIFARWITRVSKVISVLILNQNLHLHYLSRINSLYGSKVFTFRMQKKTVELFCRVFANITIIIYYQFISWESLRAATKINNMCMETFHDSNVKFAPSLPLTWNSLIPVRSQTKSPDHCSPPPQLHINPPSSNPPDFSFKNTGSGSNVFVPVLEILLIAWKL